MTRYMKVLVALDYSCSFSVLLIHCQITQHIVSLNTEFMLRFSANDLTLKVLNFWKLTSYCSLKPLWSGLGGSSAGSYLADPTSPIPFHCAVIILCPSASIVMTSTVRVNTRTHTQLKSKRNCRKIKPCFIDSHFLKALHFYRYQSNMFKPSHSNHSFKLSSH